MNPVSITSQLHGETITITADENYGGAISIMTWNGTNFVAHPAGAVGDNGQELQTAIHSEAYQGSWQSECYNPTEGGSYTDNGESSSTVVIGMVGDENVLTTEANMAFYANPKLGSKDCPNPINNTFQSDVILQKTVTAGFNPSIPQAIEYTVNFILPSNYAYPEWNAVEVIAWYLPNSNGAEFNTFLQNNPITGTNKDVTANVEDEGGNGLIQANYPVILSYANAEFAGAIYSPQVQALNNYNYDQFYNPNMVTPQNSTNKLGLVFYIDNLVLGQLYTYTFYLVIGALADVNLGLAALILAYPPPVPSISYPDNVYTFVQSIVIPDLNPANVGGPIVSYSITPNLPENTGLSFNGVTGEIYGNPGILSASTVYSVIAAGLGGYSSGFNITISVVVAVPFIIENNSNNSISYTFKGIDGTSGSVGGTSSANSGTNPPVAVPTGTYEVIISPAGIPVNCDMIFNTGQSAYNTPGYTFNNISVSNSATNLLLVTKP